MTPRGRRLAWVGAGAAFVRAFFAFRPYRRFGLAELLMLDGLEASSNRLLNAFLAQIDFRVRNSKLNGAR